MANDISDGNNGIKVGIRMYTIECLETGVHFWTDFLKVHFQPQSLFELSGV